MNEELQAASHHIHGESIKEYIITEVRPAFFFLFLSYVYYANSVYICFCSTKPIFVTPNFWVFFSAFS